MSAIHKTFWAFIHIEYWKFTDTVPGFPGGEYPLIIQMYHSISLIFYPEDSNSILKSLLYLSCQNCCLVYPSILLELRTAFSAFLLQSLFELMPQADCRTPWHWVVLMCLFTGLLHLMDPLQFHTLCRFHCSWAHYGMSQSPRAKISPTCIRSHA